MFRRKKVLDQESLYRILYKTRADLERTYFKEVNSIWLKGGSHGRVDTLLVLILLSDYLIDAVEDE